MCLIKTGRKYAIYESVNSGGEQLESSNTATQRERGDLKFMCNSLETITKLKNKRVKMCKKREKKRDWTGLDSLLGGEDVANHVSEDADEGGHEAGHDDCREQKTSETRSHLRF